MIDFNESRWKRVEDAYEGFWNRTLERPVLPYVLYGRDPGREKPSAPLLSLTSCLELDIPAEALIDRIDYELSCCEFIGDAFPFFGMEAFGPGVMAAFLGAQPSYAGGSVWFHLPGEPELSSIHPVYDPENIWLQRVMDIYRAGINRWGGDVIMGMPDLGGIMDVLCSLRGTQNLLMDMYDCPEEIDRLVHELHNIWNILFNEVNKVLAPTARGYADWVGIFSKQPCYTIQSDYAYMIGPEAFRRFILGVLEDNTKVIPNTIYHLDGPGQLIHLEDILSLPMLNAVQWVPGDGNPSQSEWPEVYRKIHAANKGIHTYDGVDCLETISRQIGSKRGLTNIPITLPISEGDDIKRRLEAAGVMP